MRYLITVTFDPDELLSNYADNQGLSIEDVDLNVEDILEQECSSWLDASGVQVLSVEEVEGID